MEKRWINHVTKHIRRFITSDRFGIVKDPAAKTQELKTRQDWDDAAEIWDPSEFDLEKENRERRLRPNDYEWEATGEFPWRGHRRRIRGG